VDFLNDIWLFRELIIPVLDILILAFVIYKGYQILVQTKAIQLVKGVFFILLVYGAAFLLNLKTLLWIMNTLAPSIVIAMAIIFQPELRRIFTRIGQGEWFRIGQRAKSFQLDAVLNAVDILSSRRRGALIVFKRSVGLKNIIDTGTRLNADLSSGLILTIFGYDTTLHDGAVVIDAGKVVAAGCFLPLSEQLDIRRSFGTRHRAALGLAEETDAVVLVVSEETGAVSLAYESNLYYDVAAREVKNRLREKLNTTEPVKEEEVALFEE
jgi:diadenylate cyclase